MRPVRNTLIMKQIGSFALMVVMNVGLAWGQTEGLDLKTQGVAQIQGKYAISRGKAPTKQAGTKEAVEARRYEGSRCCVPAVVATEIQARNSG
jgi:hypothetical protein